MDIVAFCQAWLGQERGMAWAYQWDGGWERWAQGQWAVFFKVNGAISARPEQYVYAGGNQRADLVFQANGFVNAIVELKCFVNGNTVKKFTDLLYKDVQKSKTGLAATQPANSTRTVIGLSVTDHPTRNEIWEHLKGGGFTHNFDQSYAFVDIWVWKA